MDNKQKLSNTVAPVQPAPAIPVVPAQEGAVINNPAPVATSSAQTGVANLPPKKLNLPNISFNKLPEMIKGMPTKFKVMGGVVLTLVILLILASFTVPGRKVVQKLVLQSPSPIPAVTPIGEVLVPSPYANDPEVLSIESKLTDFERDLSGTVLGEDTLRPPSVDWDVSFKSQ